MPSQKENLRIIFFDGKQSSLTRAFHKDDKAPLAELDSLKTFNPFSHVSDHYLRVVWPEAVVGKQRIIHMKMLSCQTRCEVALARLTSRCIFFGVELGILCDEFKRIIVETVRIWS